jgi:hypothetical protein
MINQEISAEREISITWLLQLSLRHEQTNLRSMLICNPVSEYKPSNSSILHFIVPCILRHPRLLLAVQLARKTVRIAKSCHACLYKNPRKRGKTTKDCTHIATPQTVKIRLQA